MHIRTRNDLIEWLENNAPHRAIARAMQEGQIENLGGFSKIPPILDPGWIVKITSKFNKIWYVVVFIHPYCHAPRLQEIDTVPWEYWLGHKTKSSLYRGDNPIQYKELRNARKAKK